MHNAHRRRFLTGTLLAAGAVVLAGAAFAEPPVVTGKKWICPPCGCTDDGKDFDAPGTCPACGFTLIEKPAAAPAPTAKPEPIPGTAKPATPAAKADAGPSPKPQ